MACKKLDEGERYACIERHALKTLKPNVCRLASIWIDDTFASLSAGMCLQAVYEAAGDPAICEQIYLEGVRPTCRAYYAQALTPMRRYTDSLLGFAAEVPSNWEIDDRESPGELGRQQTGCPPVSPRSFVLVGFGPSTDALSLTKCYTTLDVPQHSADDSACRGSIGSEAGCTDSRNGWEGRLTMEELNVSATAVMVHLLITCIPWLIGIAIGGGLGVLCGFGIRAAFSSSPPLRRASVLLPWRTFLTGLLMGVWSPFIATLLGLGPITGGVMIAGSVSVLVTTFAATTLLEYWYPSPLASRLVAGTRTLAVASGLLAAGVGLLGGGGLGYIILEATRLSQYGVMWKGLLVVLALALVLDLTLGLAQMIALQHSGESGEPASAERIAA